jgi:hypothetical protein
MSIDKNSTGFPEVNLHKKTTQVNVGMTLGIVLFLLGTAAVAFWTSLQAKAPSGPSPSTIERPTP